MLLLITVSGCEGENMMQCGYACRNSDPPGRRNETHAYTMHCLSEHLPVPGGKALEPEGRTSRATDRPNRAFDSPDWCQRSVK